MKQLSIALGICMLLLTLSARAQDPPRLIIRGDDIGSTHGANLGCIQSYKEGIMQSVQIMVK